MLLVGLVVLVVASPAHAQRAEADAAFQRGRKLLASGNVAEACKAFETSMRLEPVTGTLYNLGLCHERLGKTASAWSELSEVARTDSNAARAKDAARRAAALEPQLTRMHLVAPSTPGLVIRRDDLDVTALVGQTVPVDPGRYRFEATAPGQTAQTIEVDITGAGKTVEVGIPPFAAASTPIAPLPHENSDYPRQLALRPLVLPRGRVEVGAGTVLSTSKDFPTNPIDLQVLARGSLGRFEGSFGFEIHMRYATPNYRPDAVRSVQAGLRYAFNPLLFVGLDYISIHPTGTVDVNSRLRAQVARKLRLLPRVSVDGRAGFTFYQRHPEGYAVRDELAVASEGRVQITATSGLSFELFVPLELNVGGSQFEHTISLGGAVGALYSLGDIDLFTQAYAQLLPSSALRTYTAGVSWRIR